MGRQDNGVIRRNVSFKPVDFATIQSTAKDSGLSFSGGVRVIVRQWVKQQLLLDLGRAAAAGLITHGQAVNQLAALVGDPDTAE